MAALPQMKKNARRAAHDSRPQSGLNPFGYDAQSIAYLGAFTDRQGESLRSNDKSPDPACPLEAE